MSLPSLDNWLLDVIRSDDAMMSWIEEYRFYFSAPLYRALRQIVNGATVIIITDKERMWFGHYIVQKFNKLSPSRPLIPLVRMEAIFGAFEGIESAMELDMLEDMLNITYCENYLFWYVGKGDDRRADIAKRSEKNLLWVFDEEVPNSLLLPSYDTFLDVKLLHLYRLFDKAVNGALFGEFELT
ncbi:MAG: hypothetical protein KU37_04680 [Sulfuricurvum sp. PC08-66]|nr:MAG: hypothetical protein KU37_04680 [Sulfuricurvum sp. PC08-66]